MSLWSRIRGAEPPRTIRAFEAGRNQRRLRSVPTSVNHINSLIRGYGKNVLARSRYLAANNAYASQAKEEYVSALVGCGIKPSSLIDDPVIKKAVAQAWLDWTDEADADGLTDLYGLQALAAAEMFEAGECFIRIRPRFPEDGLTVPFQLQLIPAEMLPLDLNYTLGDAGRVECGIQFGPIGNRTFYHFLTRHPGQDQYVTPTDPNYYTVVPADQVLPLFKPTRAGQIRGIPHTLSGIVSAAMLDQYDDAELERKRLAALFSAFVTRPALTDEDHPLETGSANSANLPAGNGFAPAGDFSLEPGAVVDLLPGEEIKFAEPADVGGNYEAFQIRQIQRMCAGLGVPYHLVTGDLRQVNYSSIRAGLVAFRRRIEAVQHAVMVYQFCRPIWTRFMDDGVLSGALPISASEYARDKRTWSRVRWIAPKWEWVDPQKDIGADQMAVAAGFKARSKVIEEYGDEPEEVDARIAADQARAMDLGIAFDVGRSGQSNVAIGEGTPDPLSAPDAGAPPAPAQASAAAVQLNIPTPWPQGEVTEVLAHDELGRIKSFIKRPVVVGE